MNDRMPWLKGSIPRTRETYESRAVISAQLMRVCPRSSLEGVSSEVQEKIRRDTETHDMTEISRQSSDTVVGVIGRRYMLLGLNPTSTDRTEPAPVAMCN